MPSDSSLRIESVVLISQLRAVKKGCLGPHYVISWDEVAKYARTNPEIEGRTAAFFNRHSERILFGTDNVAPADQAAQLRVFHLWDPIWESLTPAASERIRKGNYERLFDAARRSVRAWEKQHVR